MHDISGCSLISETNCVSCELKLVRHIIMVKSEIKPGVLCVYHEELCFFNDLEKCSELFDIADPSGECIPELRLKGHQKEG